MRSHCHDLSTLRADVSLACAAMNRACARPACADLATATFVYDYEARTTWLDGLAGERHPMAYDLCAVHADGLRVPRGWRLVDRRGDARRGDGRLGDGRYADARQNDDRRGDGPRAGALAS